ncbi:MAG: carboxypeptidase-like regulatory domain-containing protein [Brumimicrobium sp.]
MKKLSIFFIIVLGVTFMSCNRKTTLKGRVMNPITGEGIGGATISASKTTLELPGGYKTVEQTTSDANGDFLLEFKKSAANIGVSTGNYYDIGWYQNGAIQPGYYLPVQQGKNMKADFYAVPYGKLMGHIKNVNCESQNDTMWFKMKYEYGDDFLPGWSFATPRIGCVDFSTNNPDKKEMGNHIVMIKIKKPSGTIIRYDTVFVNKDGITYYELFY